ncbi:hypothetical protein [Phytopseudomonas seleniipraecipitans]|uniref:hypothetical protein n=1 Tax=Phytopseudomonas seleniipraecipitans TaxID=640205 RepID=UPI00116004BD|nr:hypothetical protein [Pseudomonas seleniipraecipitans]
MKASPMSQAHKNSFLSGSQPLWKAFWILYFLGGFAFTITALTVLKVASSNRLPSQMASLMGVSTEYFLVLAITVIVSAYLIYFIYCLISVLRCAKNTASKSASLAARFIVIVNACWISYKIPTSIALLNSYFLS